VDFWIKKMPATVRGTGLLKSAMDKKYIVSFFQRKYEKVSVVENLHRYM
jgi:hypothetical protein